ncbi:MBL fold metallo-hydrolase RNA specificity domain-containing protein [Caldisericum sp. AR60]|uniref:MBL fold metallo-hydrolase RNA specificity domain-containing protein n=1 Tax=Caldisericum sp. AR60 TaxID=3397852 RepID=UPI0039FD4718
MKIKIFDGHNVIGGNKIFVESKSGQSFILDFGKNFKQFSQYFEEFLTPRAGAGLHDFWKLNLIPHLKGLYREGLLYYVKDEVDKALTINPVAVFVSHGHMDHFGYISFLREDIPIIATPITHHIIKAYQDTGNQSFFEEFYIVSNVAFVNGVKEQKLKKDPDNKIERNFRYPKVSSKSENKVSFESEELGDFKYRVFEVDHSVLGASSIYFEVDGIKVAYTGDIRFHGKGAHKTEEFFEFLSQNGVDVLLIEGTRINENSLQKLDEPQLREEDIKQNAIKVVNSNKGKLVIADFGARNIERLEIFFEIAKETGRRLAITMKDAYLLHLLKSDGVNIIDEANIVIIESKREQNRVWINEIKKNDAYKDRFVTIPEIGKSPQDYIVCYSFWDMPNLLDIEINGGAYIYSTSEAYTEEQMFDTHRLLNWISTFNLTPYGLEVGDDAIPTFTREYHVSGHASPRDLLKHIEIAKPRYIIPIHTENLLSYSDLLRSKLGYNFQIITETDQSGILTFDL